QRQSLYTAYEVLQAKPVFDRCSISAQLTAQNHWITKYLPHQRLPKAKHKFTPPSTSAVFDFLDRVAYQLQYRYMKPHITREHVTREMAFFHPRNTQAEVDTSLQQIMKKVL
ncbi:MAG: hypothetical protein M3Q81_05570, partial [bacterium]|nr:hypothetical protein [bacterium]